MKILNNKSVRAKLLREKKKFYISFYDKRKVYVI